MDTNDKSTGTACVGSTPLLGGIVRAPWTDEQVAALELRQDNEMLHEYTCECGHQLIPSNKGWWCEECPYTQDWAHAYDLIPPNVTGEPRRGGE